MKLSEMVRNSAGVVLVATLSVVAVATPVGPAAADPAGNCAVKAGDPAPTTIPWAQERLDFERVHGLATGEGMTIAVIDTGIAQKQPETRGIKLANPTNVMGAPYPADNIYDCEDYGHGTRVSSIIAAPVREGVGFAGLAPDATIMPIKFMDSDDGDVGGDSAAIARGILAAINAGADVINVSLQSPEAPELRAAIQAALEADVVIVAASGNDNGQGVPATYPAQYAAGDAFPNLIAVGASDINDQVAPISIRGDYLGVAAPGVGITAPTQIQGYFTEDGTSFATPYVSATAALVRQLHPKLSAAQVVTRLKATADRPGVSVPDDGLGWGVVNPYRALTAVRDDARLEAEPAKLPAVPAPNLPDEPDHTLRNRAYAVGAGLLLAALVFVVGSIAWRHTADRRRAAMQRGN